MTYLIAVVVALLPMVGGLAYAWLAAALVARRESLIPTPPKECGTP